MNIPPRLMIAAPQGRSGKTMVSIGLCALLKKNRLSVQPFKKGPDYIDASWLSASSGQHCRNLDVFLMSEETLVKNFELASVGHDFLVIEGNMGLYDGIDSSGKGSSAYLARLLHTPVILVINTSRMTRSVAALVKGYQIFEPETPVAGVILNNVSGLRHEAKLVNAIEGYCNIPVVGSIPRDTNISIPERHLGLVPFGESVSGNLTIGRILRVVERHLKLDSILSIAKSAEAYTTKTLKRKKCEEAKVTIGVIFDKAFRFYYPENLEALESCGAELVFIDSLNDQKLPQIDGLYIGGGFPELHLKELQGNKGLTKDIADAVENRLPVYAECAGLVYLSDGVVINSTLHKMAGVIPCQVEFCQRPQGHGYVDAEVVRENPFYPVGAVIRGHEFHYTKLTSLSHPECVMRMRRGNGINSSHDGIVYKNMFASYTHIHASGTTDWAPSFVSLAVQWKKHQPSSIQQFSSKEAVHG